MLDEADDFVHAVVGHDRARVLGVPVEKTVAVARESEEVVLLLHVFDGALVNGAIASHEIVLDVVGLTRHAVETAVGIEFDVAVVVTGLEQALNSDAMAIFGGADEVVVGDVEFAPRVGEQRGNGVDELAWGHAGGVGGLLNLQAVLVGAGEEVDVLAEQALPAAQGVTHDGCVRMAEVRLGVDVINGCRRVERVALTRVLVTGHDHRARLRRH